MLTPTPIPAFALTDSPPVSKDVAFELGVEVVVGVDEDVDVDDAAGVVDVDEVLNDLARMLKPGEDI
jgi:hypothetical protein